MASAAAAQAQAQASDAQRLFFMEDLFNQAQQQPQPQDGLDDGLRHQSQRHISLQPQQPQQPQQQQQQQQQEPQPMGSSMPGMAGMGGMGMSPVSNSTPRCTPREAFWEAITEALIVVALYLIVAVGKSLHDRQALDTLRSGELWMLFFLLVVIGTFLKTVNNKLRDSLLNASIFNTLLILLTPIKRMQTM
jgi:hypothetical protein